MADTVVITTADTSPAVLQPALTDAIAAALAYQIQSGVNAAAAAASATAAANSATAATASVGAAATAAADAAVASIASSILTVVNIGSPILATRARLQRALNNAGALQIVKDYVMNNYNWFDTVALEWAEDIYFPSGGLVYNMVKTAIPYDDTQATALWQAAYDLP